MRQELIILAISILIVVLETEKITSYNSNTMKIRNLNLLR